MIKYIKRKLLERRVVKLIDKANQRQKLTGYKYMVIMWEGKPVIVKKQEIKRMIANGYFRKGTTIQELERNAIYITR